MTSAREQYIVGVDLGGTNIVAGAMTADGSRHLAMRSIPTNAFAGDEGVAERIVALVEGVILDSMEQTDCARATSSALAWARRGRWTASGGSCSSRRISAGRTFRSRSEFRAGSVFRRRSTTC